MNVPLFTIWAHSASRSSSEPSTQWMFLGLVSSAIFSTHRSRCLLPLNALETLRAGFIVTIAIRAYLRADSVAACAGAASTYSIQLVIISSSLLSPQRIDLAGSGLARLLGLLS